MNFENEINRLWITLANVAEVQTMSEYDKGHKAGLKLGQEMGFMRAYIRLENLLREHHHEEEEAVAAFKESINREFGSIPDEEEGES